MQRIYIFLIIAVIVFAASYNDTIKQFFTPEKPGDETVQEQKKITAPDESYEQLRIDLYRIATNLSDLQGKAQLLKMAQENREWFTEENYAHLDALIETTEQELAAAQEAYEKAKKRIYQDNCPDDGRGILQSAVTVSIHNGVKGREGFY